MLFLHVTSDSKFPVALLNSVHFLQLMLDNSQAKAKTMSDISLPASLHVDLCFHAILLISRDVGKKKLKVNRHAVNSTLVSMAASLVHNALDALTKSCSVGLLRALIGPYMWFNFSVIQFRVLLWYSGGFLSLE